MWDGQGNKWSINQSHAAANWDDTGSKPVMKNKHLFSNDPPPPNEA